MQPTTTNHVSAIELQQVSFAYSESPLFQNVTLKFEKGIIHGILGPNGAGKSTLIKILAGLLKPHIGRVLLHNQDTGDDFSLFGKSIGLLSDRPPLYPTMIVYDYLLFCAEIKKVQNPKDVVKKIIEKLDLSLVSQSVIQTLSTGYRQRVALAQALVHNPAILILDEPTSGLDPQSAANLKNVLQELSQDHTILFSSHILNEVQQLCSHITMVNRGQIVYHGQMRDMLHLGDELGSVKVKILFSSEKSVNVENVMKRLNIKKHQVQVLSDVRFEIEVYLNSLKEINSIVLQLLDQQFFIEQIIEKKHDLEESFLQLISPEKQVDKNI